MSHLRLLAALLLILSLCASTTTPRATAQGAAPAAVSIVSAANDVITITWTQQSNATISWLYRTEFGRQPMAVGSVRGHAGDTLTLTDAYGPVGTRYTLYEYRAGASGYESLGVYDLGAVLPPPAARLYLPVVKR